MKPLKDFEITRDEKEGVRILRLVGVLDDYTMHRLRSALQNLHRAGEHKIVLNCENVDYVSTAAIRVLHDLVQSHRDAQGNVVLVQVSDRIKPIIEVLGLTGEFTFCDSEKKALELLSGDATPEQGKKTGSAG